MKINKQANGLFDIELDGAIIGGGSIVEEEGDSYLERIDIDEDFRNQGHGTKALYAIEKAYGSYYLAPDNADAQRLYDRVCSEMNQADYGRFGFAIDQGFGVYEI